MSRSFRKTPITGNARSRSEKFYKKTRAGQERTKVRNLLAHGEFDQVDTELAPWNEYETGRNGKAWNANFYNGEIHPKFRSPEWYAQKTGYVEFDPVLAKKRRSK